MKVCKTPAGSKRYFTHNELTGWWAEHIRYTPPEPKRKKRKKQKRKGNGLLIVKGQPKMPSTFRKGK